jgi:hypothetical protein
MKTYLIAAVLATTFTVAAPQETSWIHIRVDGKETVRVNVPLALAEKVLPAIQVNKMHQGKIKIGNDYMNSLNIEPHQFLAAVRDTPDGVFVTMENRDQSVRVAKEGGYLIVKVRPGKHESQHRQESVDVRLPLDVLEAMTKGASDELDIAAAIRVLASHHDLSLISVTDDRETVRIWIDRKSSAD